MIFSFQLKKSNDYFNWKGKFFERLKDVLKKLRLGKTDTLFLFVVLHFRVYFLKQLAIRLLSVSKISESFLMIIKTKYSIKSIEITLRNFKVKKRILHKITTKPSVEGFVVILN
jgi:hypothetical protein